MVHGESGILACSPADRRPLWQASRRRLLWPNGAIAEICSAYDYEALRGRQFDAAWADELAKWKHADKAWDMLQFTLRLGENPRQCVSTTPRNMQLLKTLMAAPSSCITHAPTEANKANLAVSFLEEVRPTAPAICNYVSKPRQLNLRGCAAAALTRICGMRVIFRLPKPQSATAFAFWHKARFCARPIPSDQFGSMKMRGIFLI